MEAGAIKKWAEESIAPGFVENRYVAAGINVVNGNGSLYRATFGTVDLGTGLAVSETHSRFRISSIGKLFTAVAIAQLLESGVILSLDDPVNRYLARMQLRNNRGVPITLHHLHFTYHSVVIEFSCLPWLLVFST